MRFLQFVDRNTKQQFHCEGLLKQPPKDLEYLADHHDFNAGDLVTFLFENRKISDLVHQYSDPSWLLVDKCHYESITIECTVIKRSQLVYHCRPKFQQSNLWVQVEACDDAQQDVLVWLLTGKQPAWVPIETE